MKSIQVAKICIFSPSLKLGGIERALTTLAEEFLRFGHEVHFVVCLKDQHFYDLPKEIAVYEPNFARTSSKFNKLLFYPRLLLYLRSRVKEINPDRVLVFGDWFSPLTLLALKGTKYPVYISDRTIPDYKFSFPIPQLKKWLYVKSAGFIAQTQRSKNFKLNQFGEKLNIKVIPNALPAFNQESKRLSNSKLKILYVGRFEWEKDPEILIRAMTLLVANNPNCKLEMAGSGPLLEPMKNLANKLGLKNHVNFLGKVSDVATLYSSASILVLPSIVEGFPNTLIEAMSFGLATICFSDIPYEDIITHRVDGLVVKERTPKALAETVVMLIEQEELREEMSLNAKESVQRFEKSFIASCVLDFMGI
ncbi:MAG: glycosyltransferase [Mongoliitalea sp.]